MRVNNSRPSAPRSESSRTESRSESSDTRRRPSDLLKPRQGDSHARTQAGQLRDISDGVRNGSITSSEAEKLLEQQKKLADATQRAKADGVVTRKEAMQLALMEAQARRSIDQAANNRERDVFAPFDKDAQRQAAQIDRIANGRQNGNITHSEAGRLLGQQADIAGARENASDPLSHWVVDHQQDQAAQDISHHSRPGTQFPGGFIPGPTPQPQPLPWPLPQPFPRPPVDIQPLPFPIRPPNDFGPRPLPEPQPFPVIKPWQGVLV